MPRPAALQPRTLAQAQPAAPAPFIPPASFPPTPQRRGPPQRVVPWSEILQAQNRAPATQP